MQIEPIGKQGDFFETIRWFPSERKLMEIEKYLSTSDFAEEYIYVSKSALPGRYRNNNNPPLIGIMNISDRKGVFKKTKFKVTVKGVQQGVTLAEQIVTARKAEKSSQSALVAMETQQKVGRTNEHRFQPLLRDSPRLADLISNNPDDTSKFNIVLKNNFNFIFGWSGSRSTLSSDPCEHLQIDEVDQWKSVVNLEDLKDRLSTYDETGTASIFSTPGLDGGPIIQEFNACDAQMDFHVECPDCGEIQIMHFEHFIWPFTEQIAKADDAEKMRIANTIEREKLARYACDGCGVLWDDHKRNKAVRLGTNHFFHGWKMRKEIVLP
ncbi:MAG: phage terminase large subunit family protein, partial [Deltaproteobacteria bacterium]|nr:phage terminase large subunit family protein [Deltaproteobacteria bacterium]